MQESLDRPDEKLQQRLSFAAEEQEDEIEVHEVADFVDGGGEIIKKEEEQEEANPESGGGGGSEDEGVQMREGEDGDGNDDGDLLDPSAAPDVGMDPRMSIVDLEESLKKELANRKVVGMTLDDADKTASANGASAAAGAAAAAKSTGATDATTAKKKKKGCCVIC